jgi:hypothetical protein
VDKPPTPLPQRHAAKVGNNITGYVVSSPGSRKVVGYVVDEEPPPHGRQHQAIRKMVMVYVIIFTLLVTMGSTEIALHGFGFFAFRSGGVGSTPDSGQQEVQGPGQPNSNGKHGCTVNSVGTCLSPVHLHPRSTP